MPVSVIAAALLSFALQGAQAPAETERERTIHMESFEGAVPDITEYALAGRFDDGDQFRVRMAQGDGAWTIRVSGDGVAGLAIRLPFESHPAVNFSRTGLGRIPTRSGAEGLYVSIAYGEPQTDCFINGHEVFSNIAFVIGPAGLDSATR